MLHEAVDSFARNSYVCARLIRDYAASDPVSFRAAALPLLATHPIDQGLRYVLTVLLQGDALEGLLSRPGLAAERAADLGKAAAAIDSNFDVRLAGAIAASRDTDSASTVRLLDVLSGLSPRLTVLPHLTRLLESAEPRVRSKAALVAGKIRSDSNWAELCMAEADPRVRANAIEALWSALPEQASALLWAATRDPHNRVVGNALLALYRMADTGAMRAIADMVGHAEPAFRTTAAWIMGETGDPRFLPLLTKLLTSSSEPGSAIPRRRILESIQRLKSRRELLLAAPPLYISLRATLAGPGDFNYLAAVYDARGSVCSSLSPTQFLVWEGLQVLSDFRAKLLEAPRPAAAALAIPRTCDPQIIQALKRALRCKRPGDSWSIIRYSGGEPAPGSGAEFTRFSTDARTVDSALGDVLNPSESAGSLNEALVRLNAGLGRLAASRHLIVVAPVAPHEVDAYYDACYAARAQRTSVYWIAPGAAPNSAGELPAGVHFLNPPGHSEAGSAIFNTCLALTPNYELHFQSESEAGVAPTPRRLQILSESGSGEVELPPLPPAAEVSNVPRKIALAAVSTPETAPQTNVLQFLSQFGRSGVQR